MCCGPPNFSIMIYPKQGIPKFSSSMSWKSLGIAPMRMTKCIKNKISMIGGFKKRNFGRGNWFSCSIPGWSYSLEEWSLDVLVCSLYTNYFRMGQLSWRTILMKTPSRSMVKDWNLTTKDKKLAWCKRPNSKNHGLVISRSIDLKKGCLRGNLREVTVV